MSGPSLLDAHLAEIDRRLRAIQSGLAPDAGMPAGRPEVLAPERSTAVEKPVAASAEAVAVSAGPFGDTGALARFERALATLPGVSKVTLREFQGADRAVFEVLIGAPIS